LNNIHLVLTIWLSHGPPYLTSFYLWNSCIPVTKDGKIVLISSSRKDDWILPKGGWEDDESLEQSAVREAYEEAGVSHHFAV